MTDKQPEALRLAKILEDGLVGYTENNEAAAELRRLHAANLDCVAWFAALRADYDALRADRHTLQATGSHPAPCARFCEANAFGAEVRRLSAENERLFQSAKAALAEADRLREVNQQLVGALEDLRDNSSLSSHQLAIISAALAAAKGEA